MIVSALLTGGAFGVRHAFEADHVAAVATLVEGDGRPASTGAAWGIGHSVPILALGAAAAALGLRPPPALIPGFEAIAAIVLIALGVRAVAGGEPIGLRLLRHVHGGEGHTHLRVAGRDIGLLHSHADQESFAVGIVHGLAGSGGVAVALVAAAPTLEDSAAFLAGFAVATVAAMGLASWAWGRGVGRTDLLRPVAGIAGAAVGVLLLAQVVGIAPSI